MTPWEDYLALPAGVAFSWSLAVRSANAAARTHRIRYKVRRSAGHVWSFYPIWLDGAA